MINSQISKIKITIHILRILLGLFFLLSAIFKLISIDEFEIYVFSHGLLSFDLSSFMARLLIGIEFFIGIMLIINLYFRQIWIISLTMHSAFTIYLAFLTISGSTENCHCFGEIFKLSPVESMMKNGIFLLLLVAIRKGKNNQLKRQSLILSLILTFSIALPNIISPPDFAYSDFGIATSTIDKNKLDSLILNNTKFPIKFDNGKKVLCFYSPKCKFCKLAEQKMSTIIHRNRLDTSFFKNIFFGKQSSLDDFYHPDGIRFEHTFIKSRDFMIITGGEMPIILLVDHKKIIHTFDYRSIDESILVNFLR